MTKAIEFREVVRAGDRVVFETQEGITTHGIVVEDNFHILGVKVENGRVLSVLRSAVHKVEP